MCEGTHPYIPVPETAEVRLTYVTPGGIAENVLNFQKDGGWDGGALTALADSVKDNWESLMTGLYGNDISLDTVTATDISTATGGQVVVPAGISGGAAGPAMPMNVTIAVSLHTAFRGRSYRGRSFQVGVPGVIVTGSTISTGTATTIQETWQAFIDAISSDVLGANLVIVSRCQGGDWLTTAVTTPVIGFSVDTTLDSQRRRLPGRGI